MDMQGPFRYSSVNKKEQDQSSFGEFEATELYCPKCGKAVPVIKSLLLILPEGDKYEYRCRLPILWHCSRRQNRPARSVLFCFKDVMNTSVVSCLWSVDNSIFKGLNSANYYMIGASFPQLPKNNRSFLPKRP